MTLTTLPKLSKHLEKLPSTRMLLSAIHVPKRVSSVKIPVSKVHIQKLVRRVTRKARSKREVVDMPHIEVIQWGNDRFGNDWPARLKKNVMKKIPKLPEPPIKPMRRSKAIRRRTPSPTYSYGKSTPTTKVS